MRIIYAGSPDIAAQPLIDIVQKGHHTVVGVITNPPSAKKRGKELLPTPVAAAAAKLNEEITSNQIKIFEPVKLSEIYEDIESLKPDMLVCFAYGKIFSRTFLGLFPKGGINLHPSLLPLYRGCAPVPAAILNNDAETGISIQRIAFEMDSGNILLQTHIKLNGTETSESLLNDVSMQGGSLLLKVLDDIENGCVSETVQDSSKATYCGMLKKEDGIINWNDTALNISAKIRAFHPWPGAFTEVDQKPLIIHKAKVYSGNLSFSECDCIPGKVLGTDKAEGILIQTGDGILSVSQLQWQTKKDMNWKDFMNGSRNFINSVCGKGE